MDAMPVLSWRQFLPSLLLVLLPSILFWRLGAASKEQGAILQEVVNSGWISRNYSKWTPGTDPCVDDWEAIVCDTTGSIITLNLSHAGLHGPVPEALGELSSLIHLDMGNNKVCNDCGPWNHVTGDLGPIANLVNLESLVLTSNELSLGTFPTALFQLKELTNLRVDNTLIRGEFPVQLATLKNLEYLYLGNNSFEGTIPGSVLASMINLKELTVWGNALTGFCPPELGKLVNLTYLNFNKNSLYGGLPPELGQLTQLQKLVLYKNKFTGPIPDSWRELVSIQDMELSSNSLYGSLPSWLLQLPKLSTLQLSNNQLRGTILSVLNRTTTPSLQTINLDCNYLEGIRPQVENMSANLAYNCWDNETSLDSACVRSLNCLNFQLATSNGKCPSCPSGQHMFNSTSCICYGDSERFRRKFGIVGVVGVVVGIVVVILFLLSYYLWRGRHTSRDKALLFLPDYFKNDKEGRQSSMYWEAPRGVQHFTFEELVKATDSFHKVHEIGEGGFGKVFVGTFRDGRTLAIKRARPANYSSESGQKPFRNEVLLLSRLHHKNLVRLEGFCDEENQQILVYEYMKLGNLHRILHGNGQGKSNFFLDWYKRLEIAVNVAQGLDYLHSFADPPVIHRDVKPSNILLDDSLIAKVADFGISKVSSELDTHISTRPAGTIGYFDPQYFLRRQLTTASDVYSFGVVLLELITGRKAIEFHCADDEETNLIEWTKLRMALAANGVDSVVDSKLQGNYPREIYSTMVDLALKCASFERHIRPSMKAVVTILEPLLQGSEKPPQMYPLQSMSSLPQPSSPTPHNLACDTGSDDSNIRPYMESNTRIEMDTLLFPR